MRDQSSGFSTTTEEDVDDDEGSENQDEDAEAEGKNSSTKNTPDSRTKPHCNTIKNRLSGVSSRRSTKNSSTNSRSSETNRKKKKKKKKEEGGKGHQRAASEEVDRKKEEVEKEEAQRAERAASESVESTERETIGRLSNISGVSASFGRLSNISASSGAESFQLVPMINPNLPPSYPSNSNMQSLTSGAIPTVGVETQESGSKEKKTSTKSTKSRKGEDRGDRDKDGRNRASGRCSAEGRVNERAESFESNKSGRERRMQVEKEENEAERGLSKSERKVRRDKRNFSLTPVVTEKLVEVLQKSHCLNKGNEKRAAVRKINSLRLHDGSNAEGDKQSKQRGRGDKQSKQRKRLQTAFGCPTKIQTGVKL